MTSFVLETYIPDGSHDRFAGDVDGLQRAVGSTGAGSPVRYLASYLVPADEMAFHLLEADSARDIERVAGRAGIEAERIVEAVDAESGRWLRREDITRRGAT
ncbi:MAG TPA: hypothetical protein VGK16_02600 [Candidatus Limnocylindrales bacterium]